jgi:hypothetical protein
MGVGETELHQTGCLIDRRGSHRGGTREISDLHRDALVAERAGYAESVWLPHQIFLGTNEDVADVLTAIEKIKTNVDELTGYEDERIRIQAMSRAERALLESKPPY